MSVSQLSVRRPVLMTVMALVILLLGFFGLTSLGIREYPNVDYPLIQVVRLIRGQMLPWSKRK